MKRIVILLEDSEYENLQEVKQRKTWKQLLLSVLKKSGEKNE